MEIPPISGSQLFWMVSSGRTEASGTGRRIRLEESGKGLFLNRE